MFVLTMDQEGSRHDRDRVPELLEALQQVATDGGFARTVGDEIQGVPATSAAATEAIRIALRNGHWHIGVGCGAGNAADFASDEDLRSARGPAFFRAREAVEASKKYPVSIAVVGQDTVLAADLEALLQLLGLVVAGRTTAQREVIDLLGEGLSGQEIARTLDISEASVSRRRTLSRLSEEEAVWPLVERLLTELDGTLDDDGNPSGTED